MSGANPGVRASTIGGAVALGVCGLIAANWLDPSPQLSSPAPSVPATSPSSKPLASDLFQGWPTNRKPDVAFVLSGQQHSYLKFCGCSSPQLGGFERRFNFMMKLRERGWPLVPLDLGDLVMHQAGTPEPQTMLKYVAAIKSLAALGYGAIGLGQHDFKLPLDKAAADTVVQKTDDYPRLLCANLLDRAVQFPHSNNKPNESMIGDVVFRGGAQGIPKIGITSVAGPHVAAACAGVQGVAFEAFDTPQGKKFTSKPALEAALKTMAANGAELRVLLYQGEYESAKLLAGAPNAEGKVDPTFADKFDLILCLCAEEEPPGQHPTIGKTLIVRVGQRGRHLVVVGAYRTGNAAKPFELMYQMVPMGEEFETDRDKEANHVILKLLDEYAKEVKNQNLLGAIPQGPHPVQAAFPNQKPVFIGSDRCKICHPADYAVWEAVIPGSKRKSHSKAFEALTKYAVKPKLRQFDPECVVCHTVGYGFTSGYVNEEKTGSLKNVGCENCHGPGSHHAADQTNKTYYPSLSPWKTQPGDLLPSLERLKLDFTALNDNEKRIVKNVNELCQKCHDVDNDPNFKFEKYWPRIVHGRGKKPAAQ